MQTRNECAFPAHFSHRSGFSLLELIVVTLVTGVLIALLLPMAPRRRVHSVSIKCVNNLKNVGLSFRIFANDNGDKFPMEISTNKGGVAGYRFDPGAAARVFKCLSNELSTPKIVICPSDKRKESPDFASLSVANVSYFVGWNATLVDPSGFLAGDRQIGFSRAVLNSPLTISSNRASNLRWAPGPHSGLGNIAFADGSVQQLTEARLRAVGANLARTNVLVVP
jgi:prepilin-type processing-associated H-X9-DG protein/prepilin-type N-terminal cleavage/methylation domain-containing protein